MDCPFASEPTSQISGPLIFVRGPIYGGKTTFSKKLAEKLKEKYARSVLIVSADNHFQTADKTFNFSRYELEVAHNKCRADAYKALKAGQIVIVDNCSIHPREFFAYLNNLGNTKVFIMSLYPELHVGENPKNISSSVLSNKLEEYSKSAIFSEAFLTSYNKEVPYGQRIPVAALKQITYHNGLCVHDGTIREKYHTLIDMERLVMIGKELDLDLI